MSFIASTPPQTQDTDGYEVGSPQQFYQDLSKLAPGDVNQPLYLPFDINGLAAGNVTTFNTDAGIPDYWYVTLRPVGNSKLSVFQGGGISGVPVRLGGGGHVKLPGLSESLTIFVEAGSAPVIGTVFAVRGYNILDLAGGDISEGSSAFGPNGQQLVIPSLYNNVSYEAQRSNYEATAFAPAARTGNTTGTPFTNYNSKGIVIIWSVTAVSGTTPVANLQLVAIDPISGAASAIYQTPNISVAGTYMYAVYPGAIATNSAYVQVAGVPIARSLRIDMGIGGTTPNFTSSVSYALLN